MNEYTLCIPSKLLRSGFPTITCYAFPLSTHTFHTPLPSHYSFLDYSKIICWRAQTRNNRAGSKILKITLVPSGVRILTKLVPYLRLRINNFYFIFVSVHHKSIIYNKPTRCNSGNIVFINTTSMLYMFRTPFASVIRSTINCKSSHWCLSWVGLE